MDEADHTKAIIREVLADPRQVKRAEAELDLARERDRESRDYVPAAPRSQRGTECPEPDHIHFRSFAPLDLASTQERKVSVVASLMSARQAAEPVDMAIEVAAKALHDLYRAVNERLLGLLDEGEWLFWWEVVHQPPRHQGEAVIFEARVQRKTTLWLCAECWKARGLQLGKSPDLIDEARQSRCDDCRRVGWLAHFDVRHHPPVRKPMPLVMAERERWMRGLSSWDQVVSGGDDAD